MITGELICTGTEFLVDIQDMNFLATSISNIESSTTSATNISSIYSWLTLNPFSGRITAQAMANISQENLHENINRSSDDDKDDDKSGETSNQDEVPNNEKETSNRHPNV
jgi:hypothetical protein